jgi:hypothetical protein
VSERQHGTNTRYHIDGCRCQPCRKAARDYERAKNRQIAYGRWRPYVDAEPARQHVLKLRAAGMGPKRIAEVSGVPHGSLAKLIYGDRKRGMSPSRRIRPETAAKILNVELDPYPHAIVAGVGARRRLRALIALGYGQSDLARRLGFEPTNFTRIVNAAPTKGVEERTRAAVAALYELLSMVPPIGATADRTRALAKERGWVPPLGLDDDRLDDPTYKRNRGPVHHLRNWPWRQEAS